MDSGPSNDEEWTNVLNNLILVSLSASQRLTQLFIHFAYYTPQKLFMWHKRDNSLCPRCERDAGTLVHMMWRCPKMVRYYTLVLDTNDKVFKMNVQMEPETFVLGWMKSFIPLLLYTATFCLL